MADVPLWIYGLITATGLWGVALLRFLMADRFEYFERKSLLGFWVLIFGVLLFVLWGKFVLDVMDPYL